jgi:hypothetical protein
VILVAGKPCTALTLTLPASGRWVARASVSESDAPASDPPTLTDEASGLSLVGRVERSGGTRVLMVGGPAALSQDVEPRSYTDAAVSLIAADMLGTAYSSRSTKAVVGTKTNWTRLGGSTRAALDVLVRHFDARWRVLDDGKVWIGTDAYPPLEDFDATILDADAAGAWTLVALQELRLRPGFTWRGLRIDAVEYSFSADEPLRATVWTTP